MAKRIQFRGGTTAQHNVFTGANREITVDTDKNTLVVHDESTVGGFPLAKESSVSAHTNRTDNPHSVTKTQVGLSNVDNTADANKVVLSASKLTTARTITIAGDASGYANFDGSANATITITVADDSHAHAFANISSKPTTLAGYGITDADTSAQVTTKINNAVAALVDSSPTTFSRIYFKNEAGGTTVVSRDTTPTSGNLVLPASGNVVSVDAAVTDNAIARYDSTTGKLQNSAITIDDSGNIGSGTQTFNGFGGGGFKNYIINGKKQINQRALVSTDNGYNQDRWYKSGNNWYQGIEGANILVSGKKYTLSWIGAATASYYVGTATRTTINAQSFTPIANGGNFTLNISAGENLWIKFASDLTGSTFNFVQLEEGSVATPFEHRPHQLELSLCQRYYESIQLNMNTYQLNGSAFGYSAPFRAIKRVQPSISVSSEAYSNATTIDATGTNIASINAIATATATGSCGFAVAFIANAEL